MPAIDFTTALARLLREPALRREFAHDASSVAGRLHVRAEDRAAVVALPLAALERQAETLLRKRFHEARKLAPHTFALLGERAWERFGSYALAHWPAGHHRHLLDALGFCEDLGTPCKSECNRLRFLAANRRLRIHWPTDQRGGGLQILFRTRDGSLRESTVQLGI